MNPFLPTPSPTPTAPLVSFILVLQLRLLHPISKEPCLHQGGNKHGRGSELGL